MIATSVDLSDARWRKSSRSGDSGGQCVEVATDLPGVVAVRDSKRIDGSALVFTPNAWTAFLAAVRNHRLGF
ncbi:DUF397 domain-containing protein [Sphaerisporangium sp. NPDC051011]|uniref:DUF397 domain-containing protein n=1 Tax=Sphaerisporangium sp. NPDC051011 TaxID=3155792 RepID=UPI0034022C17